MLHRLRSLVLLTCLASTTLIACGGDDDDDSATGGKGGTSSAGAGGAAAGTSAGVSGSSGQSGTAGAAGSTAGAGGANGGTAGTSAGTAGSAGGSVPVGGSGGAGGATAGTAGTGAGTAGTSAGGTSAGAAGMSAGGAGGASGGSGGSGGSANACLPPNVLIVLDRTMSMHLDPNGNKPTDAPDYKTSKWYQAISAVEQMVSPPTDATIRFGLEVWPKDPKDGTCVTLAQRVAGESATNPICQEGEIPVPVGLNNGKAIADYLDPASTLLCISTPTGTALEGAGDYLEQNTEEGREKYVILVTDGADWQTGGCPDPDPLPVVKDLAKKGIKTFVVGFSTQLDKPIGPGNGTGTSFLNDMACAGQTAKGFPDSCKATSDGGYVALDNTASPIYLQAGSGDQLASTLQSVAAPLCCDCSTTCEPPDMLFVLDRTQSMHFTAQGAKPTDAPAYASSKWSQAIAGIEKITATPRDQYFRFGLELWPRDPKNGTCITLAERIAGKDSTNPLCDKSEIAVDTGLGTGQSIADALDPATTKLCKYTPTGTALTDASSYLATHYSPGRRQYAVLVTDGADWATGGCPDPAPLGVVQKMAASGIKTFIVGFSGNPDLPIDMTGSSLGKTFLNDMACAGQTALGFPATCKLTTAGYVAADNTGPRLYLTAENSDELASTINTATDSLACKP